MSLVKTVEMRVLADAGDAQAQLDDLDEKARALDGDAIRMRFRLDDAAGKTQLDDLKAQADRLGLKDVDIKVRVDGAGRAIADLSAVRAGLDAASDASKVAADASKAEGDPSSRIPSISGVGVTDADRSMAKIRGLEAQVDELKAKTREDIRLKVDTEGVARSIAEMRVLDEQIDALKRKGSEGGGGGFLSGLRGQISTVMNAGPSLPEAIPLIGGMGPAGLAAVGAGVAALLPEIVAVGSGFAAAGAGAGAFAALAIPAVKKVESAYTTLSSAQKTYQSAMALYKLDPTSANKTSLVTSAAQFTLAQEAIKKLSPDEQGAVKGIQELTTEYGKMSKAFEPQAFKVFNDGLKVANTLLPTVTPFANTFATSFDGIVRRLGQAIVPTKTFTELLPRMGGGLDILKKVTVPTGFGQFLNALHSIEGPAVTAIGAGIGQVASAFGKLLTTFSGKDVSRAIGIAFGGISGVINGVRGSIDLLKTAFDSISQTSTFKRLASDFTTAWDSITKTGGKKPDFSALTSAVKDAVSTSITWLSQKMGPLIDGALKTAGQWLDKNAATVLAPAGKAIMDGLIQGAESQMPNLLTFMGKVALQIAEHKGPLDYDRQLLVPNGQAIMSGLLKGISTSTPAVTKKVTSIASSIVTALQGGQSAITAAAKAAGNAVAGPDSAISGAITKLKADVAGNTGLTKWLTKENTKLQGLAAQRADLEAEITDSQQIAQAALQNASIMNAGTYVPALSASGPQASSLTVQGMQEMAQDQQAFAQQVKQLQKMGLNSTSLNQIVQSGVSSGLPVAEGLTSGGAGGIKQVNALQKSIQSSASQLGDAGAQSMYQAGVAAAQGLAKGIQSQLASVNSAMSKLSAGIVATIKKDLDIKSPSGVGRALGRNFGGSVGLGVTDMLGSAAAASRQLAASVAGGFGAAAARSTGGGGDTYHIHIEGIVANPQAAGLQVVQLLRQYKRKGGNATLGIA